MREKENVFALRGEEPGAEQKWGGVRGVCGWEQGRCGDMRGHWGSGGGKGVSDFCVCGKREDRGSYWRRSKDKLKGKESCFIFVVVFSYTVR